VSSIDPKTCSGEFAAPQTWSSREKSGIYSRRRYGFRRHGDENCIVSYIYSRRFTCPAPCTQARCTRRLVDGTGRAQGRGQVIEAPAETAGFCHARQARGLRRARTAKQITFERKFNFPTISFAGMTKRNGLQGSSLRISRSPH